MGKIKIGLIVLGSMALIGLVVAGMVMANSLQGKLIALDAGHGGGETGATNEINSITVTEADLNWDVVNALKAKLEAPEIGAYVVVADRLSTRRDRVNDALAKCAALDIDGDKVADNRKCDVLVSVHHNGSTDPTHDGTMVIYNEKQDIPLAKALLEALVPLTGNNESLDHGGYGMTVYGHLVSALTEAYYITNDCEAELYLYSKGQLTDISQSCKNNGYALENRIDREAGLQVDGLNNYFSSQTGGKGKPKN